MYSLQTSFDSHISPFFISGNANFVMFVDVSVLKNKIYIFIELFKHEKLSLFRWSYSNGKRIRNRLECE